MPHTLAPTVIRNGNLASIAAELADQRARSLDVVVAAKALTMLDDGTLTVPVPAQDPEITDDGVGPARPAFLARGTLGTVASGDCATRYGIHSAYWKKMSAEQHLPLRATNFNYWANQDDASVLVRMFANDNSDAWVRAILSDRFAVHYDSLDALASALEGIRAAGIDPQNITSIGDVTESSFRMRITVPGVNIAVPDLARGYRNPRADRNPTDANVGDLLAAGIEIRNSDTGNGAFNVYPRLVFLVCTNGMTREQDGNRRVHIGSRMNEGVVTWAADTKRAALDLMVKQTRDAVALFMSPGYLEGVAAEMREAKGTRVESPTEIIPKIIKAVRLSEDRTSAIIDMFILGGDPTVLGVGQAITAAAQDEADADVAAAMEAAFFPALAEGVKLSR